MTSQRMRLVFLVASILLGGCATPPPPVDYTAFENSKPASLLVLPPASDAPDIRATPAVWAHATRPLAEAGYYVLPVTLVDETLRSNGIQTAADAQAIPHQKLREVFGADAAVYVTVSRYGTSYKLIDSETRVEVSARIIDLRTGRPLWQSSAFASSAEQRQSHQGGLVGLLVGAIVNQIVGTATDASFKIAGTASDRLLGAPRVNGVLPGPRSALYGKPMPTQ